jgi:hypothetical protein
MRRQVKNGIVESLRADRSSIIEDFAIEAPSDLAGCSAKTQFLLGRVIYVVDVSKGKGFQERSRVSHLKYDWVEGSGRRVELKVLDTIDASKCQEDVLRSKEIVVKLNDKGSVAGPLKGPSSPE